MTTPTIHFQGGLQSPADLVSIHARRALLLDPSLSTSLFGRREHVATFEGTSTAVGSLSGTRRVRRALLSGYPASDAIVIGRRSAPQARLSSAPSALAPVAVLAGVHGGPRAAMTGKTVQPGTLATQDGPLRRSVLWGGAATDALIIARRQPRRSYLFAPDPVQRGGLLMPDYPIVGSEIGEPFYAAMLTDDIQLSGSLDVSWIQALQDTLRITSTPTTLLGALARVGETLTFKDMVSIAFAMLVQESVSIGGSPTASLRHALQLADALTLTSGIGSALDAQVTVATAFAMADSLASVYPNALAESVDLSGSVAATLRATLKLLDAMRVQDGVTPGVTWLVQTDETFELTDANATTATLGMLLADGIEMLGELRFEDGAYLAWVVNTESRAFVKYRNFPFNSFARIGNRYFGCSGDGIYELAGDDDAGEPINAVVRGGLTDLGSSLLKNMPAAYIGYRGADQMVLKVTVMAVQKNGDIEREEHWYRMEPRQANAIRENRVKLGRGLKSTYWGWELTNINGADFDVDSYSWYPVVLERRLN